MMPIYMNPRWIAHKDAWSSKVLDMRLTENKKG